MALPKWWLNIDISGGRGGVKGKWKN